MSNYVFQNIQLLNFLSLSTVLTISSAYLSRCLLDYFIEEQMMQKTDIFPFFTTVINQKYTKLSKQVQGLGVI